MVTTPSPSLCSASLPNDTGRSRYAVENKHRTLHGALLDARLLAEVYLSMTRGQETLAIDLGSGGAGSADEVKIDASGLIVLAASGEELAEHEKLLDGIDKQAKGGSVWRRLGASPAKSG